MPVYFIRAGEGGPVKIGWAEHGPSRLYKLQLAHYEELHLIREIPGGRKAEAWMHRRFNRLWIRGEWFWFDPDMMHVVPEVETDAPSRMMPGVFRSPELENAITATGGVSALANMLGVKPQAVSQWKRVPAERVLAVEVASGVSRHELRPDLYPLETARKRRSA